MDAPDVLTPDTRICYELYPPLLPGQGGPYPCLRCAGQPSCPILQHPIEAVWERRNHQHLFNQENQKGKQQLELEQQQHHQWQWQQRQQQQQQQQQHHLMEQQEKNRYLLEQQTSHPHEYQQQQPWQQQYAQPQLRPERQQQSQQRPLPQAPAQQAPQLQEQQFYQPSRIDHYNRPHPSVYRPKKNQQPRPFPGEHEPHLVLLNPPWEFHCVCGRRVPLPPYPHPQRQPEYDYNLVKVEQRMPENTLQRRDPHIIPQPPPGWQPPLVPPENGHGHRPPLEVKRHSCPPFPPFKIREHDHGPKALDPMRPPFVPDRPVLPNPELEEKVPALVIAETPKTPTLTSGVVTFERTTERGIGEIVEEKEEEEGVYDEAFLIPANLLNSSIPQSEDKGTEEVNGLNRIAQAGQGSRKQGSVELPALRLPSVKECKGYNPAELGQFLEVLYPQGSRT